MSYPATIIRECAEQVLPGCFFLHGEAEAANRDVDQATSEDRIVWLDDLMPYTLTTNRFGVPTGQAFQCLLMLLVPSLPSDTPEQREPRVQAMLDAAQQLFVKLGQHPAVEAVKFLRGNTIYNQFDLNSDGASLVVELTPRTKPQLC